MGPTTSSGTRASSCLPEGHIPQVSLPHRQAHPAARAAKRPTAGVPGAPCPSMNDHPSGMYGGAATETTSSADPYHGRTGRTVIHPPNAQRLATV